jgi:hypothetical protein
LGRSEDPRLVQSHLFRRSSQGRGAGGIRLSFSGMLRLP